MLPSSADLNEYGGALTDYAPVVDPTTDEKAIFRNRYAIDVAGMTRTAPRGLFSFVGVDNANPIFPPSGFKVDTVYGANPAYDPIITRFSEGVYDAVLPANVQQADIYAKPASIGGGVTIAVNVRRATGDCECSDGLLRHVKVERTGANTLRIRCFNAAGALDDLAAQVVTVWWW